MSLICGTQKTGPEEIDASCWNQVLQGFRTRASNVFMATDVLGRGIDVPTVTLVAAAFDLPQLSDGRSRNVRPT